MFNFEFGFDPDAKSNPKSCMNCIFFRTECDPLFDSLCEEYIKILKLDKMELML